MGSNAARDGWDALASVRLLAPHAESYDSLTYHAKVIYSTPVMNEPRPLQELLEFAAEQERVRERQETIGETIKMNRKALGLNQQELADALGRTQGYVSMVENGERTPSPDTLREIHAAFSAVTTTSATTAGKGDAHVDANTARANARRTRRS